jgi:membrane-associated phospholipid phosphatase
LTSRVAWAAHLRGAGVAIALMAGGMGLYFLIANDGRAATSTRTFLDDGVPLWPGFIWVYLSIYALSPFLALGASWDTIRGALLRGALILGVSFGCFIAFPTIVERPDLSALEPSATTSLIRWVYEVDTPARNAAPSGHVSLAILIAWAAWQTIRHSGARVAIALYATLVSVSIVLVGQHHVLDLITGALVGGVALWILGRARTGPRPEPR